MYSSWGNTVLNWGRFLYVRVDSTFCYFVFCQRQCYSPEQPTVRLDFSITSIEHDARGSRRLESGVNNSTSPRTSPWAHSEVCTEVMSVLSVIGNQEVPRRGNLKQDAVHINFNFKFRPLVQIIGYYMGKIHTDADIGLCLSIKWE
jgi:hypothetical protein